MPVVCPLPLGLCTAGYALVVFLAVVGSSVSVFATSSPEPSVGAFVSRKSCPMRRVCQTTKGGGVPNMGCWVTIESL